MFEKLLFFNKYIVFSPLTLTLRSYQARKSAEPLERSTVEKHTGKGIAQGRAEAAGAHPRHG
jgi:hypothetical protein